MKALVIGCGSIGRCHLRNLRALGVTDLAGCDPSAAALKRAAAEIDGLQVFATSEDAIDFGPDAVLVTSPTSLHVDHARLALQWGCDLFVEKPLAASVADGEALAAAAESVDAVTLVGCNMRFHWGLREMKRVVESGVLGRLVSARLEVGQWLPDWRPDTDYSTSYSAKRGLGGGIVLDAIHELDYAIWLFGEPSEATGLAARLSDLQIETEDTAEFVLRFEGGPLASVHMDYVQRAYSRSCKVVGTQGTAIWDWELRVFRVFLAETGTWDVVSEPPDWELNTMYVEEMRYFLDCVSARRQTMNSFSAAAGTLSIALSVQRG